MEDYMSEADNEVDGQYFADLNYFYEQKEIIRREVEQSKIKKEENRKEQLIRQNKCIDNLKNKLKQKDQRIAELKQELAKYKDLQDRLGLKNADEFEWFVMLDLLTDNEKNMHILDLHRELAELKEKAIVPKFRIGQEVFVVDNECQIAQGVVDVILTGQDVFEKWCKYSIDLGVEYEDDIRFIDKNEEEIFATKEETQDKLKEIQGNE